MKILLIHFKFFNSGGPETYLFNIRKLLKSKGHEVIDFSNLYDSNEFSRYKQYFLIPETGTEEFHLHKLKLSFFRKISIFKNHIYNCKAKRALENQIKVTKPDIAYILSFKGKLSPSIFDVLKKNKIPIVHRISDFSLVCLNNIYFRNKKICRECDKSFIYGLIYRCERNSFLQSLATYISLWVFYVRGKQKEINTIICPSISTAKLFKENKRYWKNRIVHIPTFFNIESPIPLSDEVFTYRYKERCFVYWGRVAEDKGVDIFINAIQILNHENILLKAKIFGVSENEYSKCIKELIKFNNHSNITLYPFLDKTELFKNVHNCIASVLPSVWFDNMPNSLIESQIIGIPVIASNIGSFPESVENDYNGFLFEAKNAKDLALKMKLVLNDENKYKIMCNNSISWAKSYYSEEKHYQGLMEEFNRLVNENNK